MVDIAEKLFPNLLTFLTQLAATGIIYLLYRKFVHEHVMNYLDKQADELSTAQNYAKEVEEEATAKSRELDAEYEKRIEQLRRSEEMMRKEAQQERAAIIRRAEEEREVLLQNAQIEIEKDREALLREVEKHVLDLAVNVTERTLESYSYDDEELFKVLESEMEQMSHETN
ncbi:MAG TPA: ATP synthase F0 subunit B [Atopostipes sp.]|nr:ATP synthase F0 subunit B [Atopostipes sp.]